MADLTSRSPTSVPEPTSSSHATSKNYVDDGLTAKQSTSAKGAASGYASLDGSTKVPIAQIPTGSSSSTVTIGNDSRLSDSRAPNGTAGGSLNGTYPNPSLDVVPLAPVTITYAASITTDVSQGNHFRITLTGALTLNAPSNPTDGQRVMWEFIQDGTGTRVLTLNSIFSFGTDITAVTLTTTINKRDFMTAVYNSTATKWYVLAFTKGY